MYRIIVYKSTEYVASNENHTSNECAELLRVEAGWLFAALPQQYCHNYIIMHMHASLNDE